MSDEVRRIVPFEATRASDDGLTLEGYAAVFDAPTLIEDWSGRFAERIRRGAFAKTIQERTPVMQFDHGSHPLIGSIPLGSITALREDDRGLFVRARLSDNWLVEPIRDAIRDGAVNGMSFRFRVIRDEEDRDADWAKEFGDDVPGRTLVEVAMPELGPVVFPAYDATEVGVRADNVLAARMTERLEQSQQVSDTDDEAAPTGTSESAVSDDVEPPEHSTTDAPQGRDNDDSTEEVRTMAHMTVEERAARQDEIRDRLQALATEHEGATMPDDIREEWDELNDEHDRHQSAINETEERRARVAQLVGDEDRTDRPRNTAGKPVNVTRTRPDNIWDLAEARTQARSIDDLPGIYTERAKRALEIASFAGADDKDEARRNVERMLERADNTDGDLARRILVTGSPIYKRAFGKAATALSTDGLTAEESRALSVGTDGEGGFAVPFDLDPSVMLTSDGVINPLRTVARVVQTVSKTWQGLASSGISVSRASEGDEAADDAPSFTQPEFTPTRVDAFVPYSRELDMDWPSLQAELTPLLADAKETEEATVFATGNGTPPNPEGLVPALIAASQEVDAGTTGSVGDADLYALEEFLGPRFRARGSFLGSKTVYNAIRQLSSGSDGGDLWVRLAAGQPNELIGYPARELSTLASAGSTTESPLVFGDFMRGFLIVDRVGMSIELVPHLFGANGRPTGDRGLFAYWRNTAGVVVPEALVALTDDGV